MTMIDVDTSPLQAAREWRGIGLVAAAMNSGLPVAQAEALEEGDPAAFSSIDEMIAAAVVYGASIGIGRDEAMALLDRTVTRQGVQVELPADGRPNEAFSGAVQERSARITARDDLAVTPPVAVAPELAEPELAEVPVLAHAIDEPVVPSIELPDVPIGPEGPTPEQAVAASGELHLDSGFGPDAHWNRDDAAYAPGELETWADDFDDYEGPASTPARRGDSFAARAGASSYAALERIVGTDRADAIADRARETTSRIGEFALTSRERLRRSEHATLFVAIGAGAILIAIVVALGGALGSDEPAGPGPAQREAAADRSTAVETTDAPAAKAGAAKAGTAAPKPVIPPARLTLDIFNAGSKKGYAKEVAAKLEGHGYKIGEVTNAKSDYTGATIIHPADMTREARILARRTGISTLQVAPGSSRRITIVVT